MFQYESIYTNNFVRTDGIPLCIMFQVFELLRINHTGRKTVNLLKDTMINN